MHGDNDYEYFEIMTVICEYMEITIWINRGNDWTNENNDCEYIEITTVICEYMEIMIWIYGGND